MTPEEIRAIGPYENDEVRPALKRVLNHPDMLELSRFVFPTWSQERVREKYQAIHDVDDFQNELIAPALKSIEAQTTGGVSLSGAEHLDRSDCRLYISNHRDIVLDPALFVYEMYMRGFPTPNVALGDNLLVNDWLTDLVKLNKSIVVRRNLPPRELLRSSQVLSSYIHDQISGCRESVWLAQREGRAKDGNDRTQPSLVKMLALARKDGIVEHLRSLRVVPVAVSYEFDPCDLLKAREILKTRKEGEYRKDPQEDLVSILTGIQGPKGRVHYALGPEISNEIARIDESALRRDEVFTSVARLLDREILELYRLWPSNLAAAAILDGQPDRVPEEERERFEVRLEKRLAEAPESERDELRTIILEMYAAPVRNKPPAVTS